MMSRHRFIFLINCLIVSLLPLLMSAKQNRQLQIERLVSIDLKEADISQVFEEISKQTGFKFAYPNDLSEKIGSISISVIKQSLTDVLDRILQNKGFTYSITGNEIAIKPSEKLKDNKTRHFAGKITDEDDLPLPSVTVYCPEVNKYVMSDINGEYDIEIPVGRSLELRFLFLGKETITVNTDTGTNDVTRNVQMVGRTVLEKVVVTGIYTRPAGQFTGSSTMISKDELSKVGNQNVLSSLKNIDPTIYIPDNIAMGSDPNTMPNISMRGTSSLPDASRSDLRTQFEHNPNQPLFILDGFETSLSTIVDMDMNRIESITILKDASAKAMYGSKAANGVIVIETKRVSGSEQRVSYTGSMSFEMPDLTSYNLTNSLEKLEVELPDGKYDSNNFLYEERLKRLYNSRKKRALEGLNTYWLAKPLRTGVGHKHTISIEIGNASNLRSFLDFTYNDIAGAMKGSDRKSYSGSINTTYRVKNFLFRNIMTAMYNKSSDSPYGSFSVYAAMNPYWQAEDENGNIPRWLEPNIPNPMYNATIGTSITSDYLEVIDNFFAEWRMSEAFTSTFRFGINKKRSEANTFLPPLHSIFADNDNSDYERRGRYTLENGKNQLLSGDFNVRYNKLINRHHIFVNLGFFVSQNDYSAFQHVAEGFSNNEIADITFARQYKDKSRPSGSSSINREASFLFAGSYDYGSRYIMDFTYRRSASSLYGKNDRWANSWSLGAAWNLHNESFAKDINWINLLKIRGSIGLTGNQNFVTNAAIETYRYMTGNLYAGQAGAYLTNMPNPDLKWEQKMDYNIGFDAKIKGLSLTFDLYRADTKNMVTDLALPTSTGFGTVKDNLGLVRNTGFELKAFWNLLKKQDWTVSLFGSVAHNKNYIVRLSESLKKYNDTMKENSEASDATRPVPLYEDGRSMTAIWVVNSAGIDPNTGREIFIKRDGSLTFDYSPNDLQPLGDSSPKLRGNAGFTAEYKGFGVNMVFTYLAGGQMYNSTLVDKVENADINYNVDRRLAVGRWRRVGQITPYKKFDFSNLAVRTRPTSRFLQNRNELHISSLSVYYEIPRTFCKKIHAERVRLTCYLNDLATISSIQVERGTTYPFARRMSFSLTTTF